MSTSHRAKKKPVVKRRRYVAAVDQLARDRALLVLRHQIAGSQVRELLVTEKPLGLDTCML